MAGSDEPPGLGSSDLAGSLGEAIHAAQHFVGLGIEQHALSCRLQPPVAAVKQREAELLLETSDLRTDGRLRYAHGCGRLRNGAVVDDGAKRFEEPYIHLSIKPRYCQAGPIMPVSPRQYGARQRR